MKHISEALATNTVRAIFDVQNLLVFDVFMQAITDLSFGWNKLGDHNSLRYFADALAKNHVRPILSLSIRYVLVLFPLDSNLSKS